MRRIVGGGSDPRCGRCDISIVVTALAAACWTLAACSSTRMVQDAAADMHASADHPAEVLPPPVDAPVDRGFILDGGVCIISLDELQPFGGCRPTFDDPTWRKDVCPTIPVIELVVGVDEQVCTGYVRRTFDLGTHRWTCYYDPSSGGLVAGYYVDDTCDLCDNTTAFVLAGEIPPKGACNDLVFVDDPCNIRGDGGTDADGGL